MTISDVLLQDFNVTTPPTKNPTSRALDISVKMRTSALVFLLALVTIATVVLVNSDSSFGAGLEPAGRVKRSSSAVVHEGNNSLNLCSDQPTHSTPKGPPAVAVAKWNWSHVGLYLTITIFIVLSGLAKVGKTIKKFY